MTENVSAIAAEIVQKMEINLFRAGLLDAVRARCSDGNDDLEYSFVCEVSERMMDVDEFNGFIPAHFEGRGARNRILKIDGYEIDEVDDSIRLLITDFKGTEDTETIIKSRVEAIFGQLQAFIEEALKGNIKGEDSEVRELSSLLIDKHDTNDKGIRFVSRYRLYLITDSILSERLKELPVGEIDGVPIEYHIWDINRLKSASISALAAEELEIDFNEFTPGGIPCLLAGKTDEYAGYLCVISGDTLTSIYDRYGSKLLEGNVRSFLSAAGKVNKGIQSTIRKEANKFFVYNNGISATATSAKIIETESGPRLISCKYLQIVNGGQTTASLHVAKRKDNANLSEVYIQMKLTVVNSNDSDTLNGLIQKIAEFSNKQNKVSDADFFSNHPFHRAIERRSRIVAAPATGGNQFNTYWFYERARGQYFNEQSKLNLKQKKDFQRINPRSQLITKSELAKYENSWRKLPHIVCGSKNFINFADYIGKQYGEDGSKFDNEAYFKNVVARAILYKYIARLLSSAKGKWFAGDYRAELITYSMAKLADVIDQQSPKVALNYKIIWEKQGVSQALGNQLEEIAKKIFENLPETKINIRELCRQEHFWNQIKELKVTVFDDFVNELLPFDVAMDELKSGQKIGYEDANINAIVHVHDLSINGCWEMLMNWSEINSKLYGKEKDLVRNAINKKWIPTAYQAKSLIKILKRLESEGFKY